MMRASRGNGGLPELGPGVVIYLGFYVKNCESLEYKSDYKPYQILQEYTELDELAIWLDEI